MGKGLENYTSRQRSGSEFGGVERTTATVQPMPGDALSAGEILRLGYLTGDDKDTESIEDRRQMVGLRPANGKRPNWTRNTGQKSYSETDLVNYLGDD